MRCIQGLAFSNCRIRAGLLTDNSSIQGTSWKICYSILTQCRDWRHSIIQGRMQSSLSTSRQVDGWFKEFGIVIRLNHFNWSLWYFLVVCCWACFVPIQTEVGKLFCWRTLFGGIPLKKSYRWVLKNQVKYKHYCNK